MNIFEKNIIQLHQEKGRQWLARLQHTIDCLTDKWTLSDVQPVDNMTWHYVAFAKQNGQTPVVIKIGCDKAVSADEYRALKYFNGHGAIDVLDYDQKYSALLLEQAVPGNLLIDERHNIESTISIYANTINTLLQQKNVSDKFVHVSHWCRAIYRITDTRVDKKYVDLAQQIRLFLLSSLKDEFVCHGDLHSENVIHHQDQWIVIDPKGIVGEVAFEAAAFDLLSDDELKNADNAPDLIFSRIKLLAEKLNIDQVRLLYWVFLRALISAQWFIEDGGDPSRMLLIANCLFSLVSKLIDEG